MGWSFVGGGTKRETSTSATSVTLSITSPVANNLLIAGIHVRRSTPIATPSGWTLIRKYENPGSAPANISAALFYRISDGSETGVTFSWSNAYEAACFYQEISGLATSGVLHGSDDDTTNVSSSSSSGGFGSLTPTEQPGLAVIFSAYVVGSSSSSLSYNDGFSSASTGPSGGMYDPYVALGYKGYSSLSAISPSVSYSSAVNNYGILALFREPSAPSSVDVTPSGLTQSQALGSSSLVTGASVSPSGLTQAQLLSTSTLAQHHVSAPASTTQAQILGSPGLTQHHALVPASAAQAQALSTPSLLVGGAVSAGSLTQAQALSAPVLTQHHVVSAGSLTQAQALGGVTLTQHYVLSAASITQAQMLGEPAIIAGWALSPNAITQAQILSPVTLSAASLILAASVTQSQTITSPSISLRWSIIADGLTQAQTIEAATLRAGMIVHDLTQTQALGIITFGGPPCTPGMRVVAVDVVNAHATITTITNARARVIH